VGQILEVRNDDSTLHNVHLRSLEMGKRQGQRTLFNRAQPAGSKPIMATLPKEQIIQIRCDAHAWMQAYIVLGDQPYFSVSDETGKFEISDVPVGEIELQVWHAFYGMKTVKVTVEEGKTATVDLSFDAKADAPAQEG
jgi:hypothetical protein